MRAGTAKIDITPTTDVWMDGMIRKHRSIGVHDPLFARALVIANDNSTGNAFAVVSVDVCGLSEEDAHSVRRSVSVKTDIPAENIIIAATHTHSGPATVGYFNPVEKDYVQRLLDKLVTVIKDAYGNMVPVAVGCVSGREDTISHYRRLLARDGHVVMNWESYPPEDIIGPLGVIDPEVGVLKITDAGNPDKIICLLFNHAGHPNVISGDNYLLSADYPGFSERLLEEKLGGVAIFLNAASGNLDIDGLKDRDWEGMERIGKALADVVTDTAKSIVLSDRPFVRGTNIRYTLPRRNITDSELAWARDILKNTRGGVEAMKDGVGDDYIARFYIELREAQYSDIAIEQVCFAIDDTAFISFPGELFTEIGMRIKKESPFERTSVVTLANGYVGYIPTRKAIGEGGYEVDTRCVDEYAEDIIVKKSLTLLKKVYRL